MIIVESKLGNLSDAAWRERAKSAAIDHLMLEQWEAPKSRLRKTSEGGIELAVSLPRSEHLQDGDVLYFDAARNLIVAARIPLKEVMVIELGKIESMAPADILRICFELGHGLGNQHWPAVIKGATVYVPLSVDRKVMSSVMRTHAFEHVASRFAPGEEIAALLTAKEMRLLFAGAGATPHHHHGDAAVYELAGSRGEGA
ncbi:urease accessory protein UreE [Aestuariivirga sp.]|uniref:urease accessory protein UreE n=1 Tax=Aestuariivirga sp. TaxID=2650926 RepID=UPI0025C53F74|nr:urease accessory protein UreE [Aestuariivirga sp.]MCA3555732.1 urease accessory protein UreE [Aestuariivirga sp.]